MVIFVRYRISDTEFRNKPNQKHVNQTRPYVEPVCLLFSNERMAPSIIHLPNGQTITVSPVFAGLSFKANDLNVHHSIFPPGWTIILETEDEKEALASSEKGDQDIPQKKHQAHRFKSPTLNSDNLFISSISNPSSTDFKPATSPTRQIAMMLWATLWWYFHQVRNTEILSDYANYLGKPAPNPHLTVGVNPQIPQNGRPKGQWRVNIKREGIFKGRHLLPKLERMGLISTEDSSVGSSTNDRNGEGWCNMFVSRRSFWQLDPRIFLFTLSPAMNSPFSGGSTPLPSRPSSPNRGDAGAAPSRPEISGDSNHGLWSPQLPGPFSSASHLPTYFPPPPIQHMFTDSIRHPIRPKPPAQGETFYTRYIPSLDQYLSFRTASMSSKSPTYRGPVAGASKTFLPPHSGVNPLGDLLSLNHMYIHPCDTDLLHTWMNDPRVAAAWGVSGPPEVQKKFLHEGLNNKHSFPVIGCWDGKPFGYFEIYWVKEDVLGRRLNSKDVSDFDRGLHALVGEQEFRGPHRVRIWTSALIHYCWLADSRTEKVLMEPRADNEKSVFLVKFYRNPNSKF